MRDYTIVKKQSGQGMTEYIIIVALIAIAAIAAYTMFGNVVRGQVGIMGAQLGGQASVDASDCKKRSGKAADKKGAKHANLSTYVKQGGTTGAYEE